MTKQADTVLSNGFGPGTAIPGGEQGSQERLGSDSLCVRCGVGVWSTR